MNRFALPTGVAFVKGAFLHALRLALPFRGRLAENDSYTVQVDSDLTGNVMPGELRPARASES